MRVMCLLFCCFWLNLVFAQPYYSINISHKEALKIGVKIWYNESGGIVAGLTTWNRSENFASVGIGHFIWYPANTRRYFSESFPHLIKFMQAKGVTVPYWLQGQATLTCPWPNRIDFLRAQYSPEMVELRQFLLETISWQADYMAYRLEAALPKILRRVPQVERPYIIKTFMQIASTSQGVYALVDYVNFKGEGISFKKNYRTQGWGLLQVLEQMRNAPETMSTLRAFAWSANQVLTRRVDQSSPWRNEAHWLPGWRKRLRTYYS